MTQSAVQARREYQRAWRQKNPDKVRKHQADYWARKAAQADLEREKSGNTGKGEGEKD